MSSLIHACVVAHLVLITVDYSSSVNIVIIYFQKKQFIKKYFQYILMFNNISSIFKKTKKQFFVTFYKYDVVNYNLLFGKKDNLLNTILAQ